ncbi:MAG: 3-chloro-4-hydroxyphenylacetate reductive dehalogenase [Anaerolineales bacterium]|nr:3-chloro-4-hydroxyphenylacetate reductive dehalogenase [Anaerolineales bacterium]
MLLPVVAWVAFLLWMPAWRAPVLILGGLVAVVSAAFLLLPLGDKGKIRVVGAQERFDERDIIFARMRYEPDSEKYGDYYARHPERKELDDRLRAMPGLCEPGSGLYHPLNSPMVDAEFITVAELRGAVDGPVNTERVEVDLGAMSRRLKGMARYYGAVLAGIAPLNPAHVYSHVGRGAGTYGEEIKLDHPYALAFAVEMDHFMVNQAPGTPTVVETAKQYLEAGKIAIVIAHYIRSLGYSARAHVDGNYRVILPPIAADAGLGEVGRMGILMSPEYGARMRLGAVTTDMPLVPDKPAPHGIVDFCERCLKCADNCPSGAITRGERAVLHGAEKWVLDADRCYEFWRRVGTDCAICMKVCPYSKPGTFIHNVIRFAAERSVIARRVSIWADDVFYTRRPRSKLLPDWMESP